MQNTVFKATTAAKATVLVSFAAFLSYLIGLVRDRIIAVNFGASDLTDVYNISFLIPDFLFNFFIAGALAASFLPVFSDYLHKDKKEAFQIANTILTGATLLITILAIVSYVFMQQIISTIFPEAAPAMRTDIIGMTRIMLLSGIFFTISNTLGNLLMSYKHFFSYSLAPIFYNLGIIGGIIFLEGKFGIYSAAVGVVIGAGLHMLIRLIDTAKTEYRYRPQLDIKHPGFKKIIRLMIPKSLSLIAWQLNLFVFAKVAINMVEGGWSAFNYARNIQSFAVSLFGIAFATAIFPYLTDTANINDDISYTKHIQKTFQKILFFTIPAAAGLIVLTQPIVELILSGGEFGQKSILMTSTLLFFFALSIPFESLSQILARAFYARQNTITPTIINITTMVLIASIAIFITPKFGIQWLSIGFTIGFVYYVIVSIILLRKHLKGFNFREFFRSFGKTVIATTTMVAIILLVQPLQDSIPIKMAHAARIAIGAISFFLTAWLIKAQEIKNIASLFRKRPEV